MEQKEKSSSHLMLLNGFMCFELCFAPVLRKSNFIFISFALFLRYSKYNTVFTVPCLAVLVSSLQYTLK